jgi:hypothetical protein
MTSRPVTARRVAAYRLGFDRLAAGFGDPSADERLAADVAGRLASSRADATAIAARARTALDAAPRPQAKH